MPLIRDTEIMETSIADNLRMGHDFDLNTLRNILIQVGLHDSITALPNGLSTHLLMNGTPLTQEQCLRLTLARALLKRPRLLMLDRVLDRIEADKLTSVISTLFAKEAPWTLIITSQLPQVINVCSRHLHIEQGKIIEAPFDQGHQK